MLPILDAAPGVLVRKLLGIGAPAVLHEPRTVGLGLLGRVSAAEIFLGIAVVVADNRNSVRGSLRVVGVVRPGLRVDVFGLAAGLVGLGLVGAKGHGDATPFLQLALDSLHGCEVRTRAGAVFVEYARVRQDVAVFEVVHAARVQVVGDGPVGVDVGAVIVLVVAGVKHLLDGLVLAFVALVGNLLFNLGDFGLGQVGDVEFISLSLLVDLVQNELADDDGVVVFRRELTLVAIRHFLFEQRTDAGGEHGRAVGGKAAAVHADVGIGGGALVALACLRGIDGLGNAARLVDRAGQLQLGEIHARLLVGGPQLGEQAGLAGRDDGEAPAGAPGVLQLHGSDHAALAQVELVGSVERDALGGGRRGGRAGLDALVCGGLLGCRAPSICDGGGAACVGQGTCRDGKG